MVCPKSTLPGDMWMKPTYFARLGTSLAGRGNSMRWIPLGGADIGEKSSVGDQARSLPDIGIGPVFASTHGHKRKGSCSVTVQTAVARTAFVARKVTTALRNSRTSIRGAERDRHESAAVGESFGIEFAGLRENVRRVEVQMDRRPLPRRTRQCSWRRFSPTLRSA